MPRCRRRAPSQGSNQDYLYAHACSHINKWYYLKSSPFDSRSGIRQPISAASKNTDGASVLPNSVGPPVYQVLNERLLHETPFFLEVSLVSDSPRSCLTPAHLLRRTNPTEPSRLSEKRAGHSRADLGSHGRAHYRTPFYDSFAVRKSGCIKGICDRGLPLGL